MLILTALWLPQCGKSHWHFVAAMRQWHLNAVLKLGLKQPIAGHHEALAIPTIKRQGGEMLVVIAPAANVSKSNAFIAPAANVLQNQTILAMMDCEVEVKK
ncbi:MAG: hypothetical protein U5N55_11940 [Cypionkella sp.]|nr:hypothetical protein [Cypionkella sp.]